MTEQLSARWDIRTGSPRKLWRGLHDLLKDYGFEHDYEELMLEESPIEGTATFSDCLIGCRDRVERASLAFLRDVLGVLLCMTILLIPLGIRLIRSSQRKARTWAVVSVEGEVYRTRGANIRNAHAAEVLDVVADARITLDIHGGPPDEDDYELVEPIVGARQLTGLKRDLQKLEQGMVALLPAETLPSTDLIP